MSADDDDIDFDELEASQQEEGEGEQTDADASAGEDVNSLGISWDSMKEWLTARRGWVLVIGLALAQGVFGVIMLGLRSEARPVGEVSIAAMQDLAVEMLGYEVKVGQIHQLIPMRGGKRMTIGLDISLILGQLPEEQIEGAPRPNAEEFALFIETIQMMEPRIRSRVNMLLQQIPTENFGTVDVYKTIKDDIKDYVNDTLEGLDFGKGLREGVGKRRVTDVLLPMFVRQMY
ncbi:MAG: flagellar basal body-associated FliL family protein [Planctomycetaceae bacterium]|nr:flagellar basal body-associated FliL family protein [Planctomycetaceae bacterium]